MSSNRRPTIGITTQSLQAIDGIPAALPASVVMNQRYYEAVAAAGAAPVLIPLLDDIDALRATYEACAGIMIPGGVDMDPGTYGEAPHERLGRVDPARDRVELQLTRWAIEDRKPLLGLCRGLQVINVAAGGTLYQDLDAQLDGAIRHDYFPTYGFDRDYVSHDVAVAPASRLRSLVEIDQLPVNSMHHQGVKRLGAGLVACAHAADGLIEAVESVNGHWMVGVQWHPEVFEADDPHTRELFRGFVRAAGGV
ncbi:MAG TPA: gamma-glutamyl-gamma-aminobutyrate hydrolase family protein [Gemmatimonadaceae bacterium]|nr:gamma-glutamyl-gamma-aminobutyrate hydrolase family protein [Gemmatimonadaceae bacterium]